MLAAENFVILPSDLNHIAMHPIFLLAEYDKSKQNSKDFQKKIVIMRTTQPAIDTAQIKPKMGTDPSLSSNTEERFTADLKNVVQAYYQSILLENTQLKEALQKAQEDNKEL